MKKNQGLAKLIFQEGEKPNDLIVAYVEFDCGRNRINIANISKKIAKSDPEILAGFVEICEKSMPVALKSEGLKAVPLNILFSEYLKQQL